MRLDNILNDPHAALIRMERWVNDGSPSGFSESHSTSPGTAPFGSASTFHLGRIRNPRGVSEFGSARPEMSMQPATTLVPLHPDVRNFLKDSNEFEELHEFEVSPTSSARTVHVHAHAPYHLKLHYEGTIGRLERSLGTKEASYAIHISQAIEALIKSGRTPSQFGILPEYYAVVSQIDMKTHTREIGAVYRSLTPVSRSAPISALLPGFSMFSSDRLAPDDDALAIQLFDAASESPEEFLLERLLFPLIDSYFSLLLGLGLQGEFHAQNVLFGIDQDGVPTSIILRDMESIDTDLDLQKDLQIDQRPPPSLHKCLTRDQSNYQIKHSFMFDHKLGEYLISPIINIFTQRGVANKERVEKEIRIRTAQHIANLPDDFYPDDGWYSFAKMQIDRSTSDRPYVRHPDILYRN